jgi:hypothetical protein
LARLPRRRCGPAGRGGPGPSPPLAGGAHRRVRPGRRGHRRRWGQRGPGRRPRNRFPGGGALRSGPAGACRLGGDQPALRRSTRRRKETEGTLRPAGSADAGQTIGVEARHAGDPPGHPAIQRTDNERRVGGKKRRHQGAAGHLRVSDGSSR